MPRANRSFLLGHVYHLTYRCHDRQFLVQFATFFCRPSLFGLRLWPSPSHRSPSHTRRRERRYKILCHKTIQPLFVSLVSFCGPGFLERHRTLDPLAATDDCPARGGQRLCATLPSGSGCKARCPKVFQQEPTEATENRASVFARFALLRGQQCPHSGSTIYGFFAPASRLGFDRQARAGSGERADPATRQSSDGVPHGP